MSALSRLFDFLAGTPAIADQVDSELNNIKDYVNQNCLVKDGTLAATAPITGVTPTAADHLATKSYADGQASAGLPVGFIAMYGSATPPTGWLLCDGAAVSRAAYANLFNVIGITYGAGNGSTTFNLPNLGQRFPVGFKSGVNSVGQAEDNPAALGTFTTGTPTTIVTTNLGSQQWVAGFAHKHVFVPPYAVVPFVIKY